MQNKIKQLEFIQKTISQMAGNLLFEAYATGKYTLKELRKIINILGLKGRRGSLLSVSNYQYLLQNPFYYGLIRYNGE